MSLSSQMLQQSQSGAPVFPSPLVGEGEKGTSAPAKGGRKRRLQHSPPVYMARTMRKHRKRHCGKTNAAISLSSLCCGFALLPWAQSHSKSMRRSLPFFLCGAKAAFAAIFSLWAECGARHHFFSVGQKTNLSSLCRVAHTSPFSFFHFFLLLQG